MNLKKYNLINNSLGWIVFLISAVVYFLTIEPTVSLWDCGEFIAGSHKMEVVHPPGAPFFLMFTRLFTIFAPSPQAVPIIVNGLSGLESAFTILFLFWTITALARKIIIKNDKDIDQGNLIAIMGSGIIGSLAFTFSDTFWFSAVEGEVYAFSTFFIAIVFWLSLKWERRANEKGNLRWIILIFYVMGISIGVHLLSLLAIPVLAYVYYFKKFKKSTKKGLLLTGIIGLIILGVVQVGVIKIFPSVASKIELLFVNSFGMPFWSGIFLSIIILIAAFVFGIRYSIKKKKVWLNTALVAIMMVFIGFSSYTMVVVRSSANTSIDYSNPENVFNFISYVNREQYGDRPIVYGQYFTAPMIDSKEGSMRYTQGEKQYIETAPRVVPVFDPKFQSIFPRMTDMGRADREQAYRSWSGMKKNQKKVKFGQNLKFFFSYQLGHMYWRYFAWNFIGRQNDYQGHGGFKYGNWKSGINFFDEGRIGKQENLPLYQRANKADNKLYFLPFILGLIGLIFHFFRRKNDAITVLILFLMTGFMLIIYLNNPPIEPRERDYTLVGSFYVFAIWIGLGVLAITDLLKQKTKLKLTTAAVIATIVSAGVPTIMACQEWDDHDRSQRYTSLDYGLNYLNSCAPNAILFTNGDNDTYPLWYAQEVEGIRDDVRVINLQLLQTGWYVEQLKRKTNNSEGIKFTHKKEDIVDGKREQIILYQPPNIDKNKYYELSEVVNFIASNNDKTKVTIQSGNKVDYYPTTKFKIKTDKEKAIKNKIVRPELKDRIVDYIKFDIKKRYIYKNSLMTLDIIANNIWDRPIYFAITAGNDAFINLGEYFQQEGLTYRLVPVKKDPKIDNAGLGRVDPVIMYNNMMERFKWGGLDKNPNIHIGSVTRRHTNNYRNIFSRLVSKLIAIGEKEKAIKAMDKCLEVTPEHYVPYDENLVLLIQFYYMADAKEKADKLAVKVGETMLEEINYYRSLSSKFKKHLKEDVERKIYYLAGMADLMQKLGKSKEAKAKGEEFMKEANKIQQMGI